MTITRFVDKGRRRREPVDIKRNFNNKINKEEKESKVDDCRIN